MDKSDKTRLGLRQPPEYLDDFQVWLRANPQADAVAHLIKDGKVSSEQAAYQLLRSNWHTDCWQFMAESYLASRRELNDLVTRLIARIQDPKLKSEALEEQRAIRRKSLSDARSNAYAKRKTIARIKKQQLESVIVAKMALTPHSRKWLRADWVDYVKQELPDALSYKEKTLSRKVNEILARAIPKRNARQSRA